MFVIVGPIRKRQTTFNVKCYINIVFHEKICVVTLSKGRYPISSLLLAPVTWRTLSLLLTYLSLSNTLISLCSYVMLNCWICLFQQRLEIKHKSLRIAQYIICRSNNLLRRILLSVTGFWSILKQNLTSRRKLHIWKLYFKKLLYYYIQVSTIFVFKHISTPHRTVLMIFF